jgi:hypothetical protein
MSKTSGSYQKNKNNPSQEIALTNRVLNFVLARGWTDYDNFSSKVATRIISASPSSGGEVIKAIATFQTPFFELNKISRASFVDSFPIEDIIDILGDFIETQPLTFLDVFPETANVSVEDGKLAVPKLDIDESLIQDALRNSLREKNTTNPIERGHDSSLEVAEPEHFWLQVKGVYWTFVGIVKGYRSLKGKTVKMKDIANQVMRAYSRTRPDYIILVLAKNPSDSIVSELTEYGNTVGNEHLVILCDPVTLARFLRARNVI